MEVESITLKIYSLINSKCKKLPWVKLIKVTHIKTSFDLNVLPENLESLYLKI